MCNCAWLNGPSTSHEISQAKSHAPLRMTTWWEGAAELRSACTGEDARAYTARANDEGRFYWPALGPKCISPSTSHEISQAKSHAPLRMTMWWEDPAELRSACTGEDARAYTARANDEERFYWPALGLKCISPSTSHEISQAKSHAPLRMTMWFEDPAELRSACTGEDARAYTARANDEERFYWPALGLKCISPSTSHEISQAKSHAPLRMTMWF